MSTVSTGATLQVPTKKNTIFENVTEADGIYDGKLQVKAKYYTVNNGLHNANRPRRFKVKSYVGEREAFLICDFLFRIFADHSNTFRPMFRRR